MSHHNISRTTPLKIANKERDARILQLRREGCTYEQIKEITGVDRGNANRVVKRYLHDIPAEQADELRQWEWEKLTRIERDTYAQAFDFQPERDSTGNPIADPVCDSNGNPLYNEDGTPMLCYRRDFQTATAGKLLLLKCHEARVKLGGLAAPTRNITTIENGELATEINLQVVDTGSRHPLIAALTMDELERVLDFIREQGMGKGPQATPQGDS